MHSFTKAEKQESRKITTKAIRDGVLVRRPCEKCGENKSQGHHKDYSKPFDIMWLCVTHHTQLHTKQGIKIRCTAILPERVGLPFKKPRLTAPQAMWMLIRQIEIAGSQAVFADSNGMSRQYLTDVLHGRRDLSGKVLEAIGLRRVVEFEQVL